MIQQILLDRIDEAIESAEMDMGETEDAVDKIWLDGLVEGLGEARKIIEKYEEGS